MGSHRAISRPSCVDQPPSFDGCARRIAFIRLLAITAAGAVVQHTTNYMLCKQRHARQAVLFVCHAHASRHTRPRRLSKASTRPSLAAGPAAPAAKTHRCRSWRRASPRQSLRWSFSRLCNRPSPTGSVASRSIPHMSSFHSSASPSIPSGRALSPMQNDSIQEPGRSTPTTGKIARVGSLHGRFYPTL